MPETSSQRWQALYNQMPLCDVPRHFASLRTSPFLMGYLTAILALCPRGGKSCETGIGSGYSAIWLSQRGVLAEGFDLVPSLVERARQVNNLLGGKAMFRTGDLFSLYEDVTGSRSDKNEAELKSDLLLLPGNDFDYPSGRALPSDALSGDALPLYDVIHHQGVLEHFTVPQIQAALAQQVALSRHVIFSVPSVYYSDPEIGDERLLPLEEWQRILAPFDIAELRYYGHPQSGDRDHILCVLRGQAVDTELLEMMQVGDKPYSEGISAIVHTRDEERHIAACLETLTPWTDEIIVCDMESSDATVEIARTFTDNIVSHPLIANFDQARNVSAMRARYAWVFYLDADERVPPALGQALRELTQTQGDSFEALLPPFRHLFAGQWLQSLYPGYTSPRLFKNGHFVFNARLHAGAQVDGRITAFPADNPDLALVHYSYDSLSHYLNKLNRYTDGEAENMARDGHPFHWQGAIRHFAQDLHNYYDLSGAHRDGVHGFIYSFLSAFYRFEQHAKLYEKRFQARQLRPEEASVPVSAEQMLEYALSVVREKPPVQLRPIQIRSAGEEAVAQEAVTQDAVSPEAVVQETVVQEAVEAGDGQVGHSQAVPSPVTGDGIAGDGLVGDGVSDGAGIHEVVWCGPLFDPSGYGEEVRNFALACAAVSQSEGLAAAAQELPWSQDCVDITSEERAHLQSLTERAVSPGFTQITQNFPTGFARHPQAGLCIGRTMFETDRLPREWVKGCNAMDYVWVPSEFNRRTFQDAGVAPEKLAVIPGCLDSAPWRNEKYAYRPSKSGGAPFTFLTVFDWTLHKGWDVLLRGFLEEFREEFKDEENVSLVFKVWSTMGYDAASIQEQANRWAQENLNHDLASDTRVRFLSEHLSSEAMRELYFSADAFVLPSRGEGWGRPYMEAMAAGLPTIGTHWSGNTAFMTDDNSYLLNCTVEDVPEVGWREIPTYRGHRWAEPSPAHLRALMRQVFEQREEGAAKGRQAREDVLSRYSREAVGALIAAELKKARGGKARDEKARGGKARGEKAVVSSPIAPAGEVSSSPASLSKIAVRWEGDQFQWHSLAHVNREFSLGLLGSERVALSLVTDGPQGFAIADDPRFAALDKAWLAPLEQPGQVHVRHSFPPRLQAPPQGHLVLIQPWEYGYLPIQWLAPIRDSVREVWCYSGYVRDVYRNSGVEESKLHVVPLGVDETVFSPNAPPYVFTVEPGAVRLNAARLNAARLNAARDQRRNNRTAREGGVANAASGNVASIDRPLTDRPFTFLFVGGTIHRKGFDILLEAYLKAFSAFDDVCLLVKDTGTHTVYRGQNHRERVIALAEDPSRPALLYVEEDLSSHQLAGIYTAADCLVMPYRGEGFLLPALEAMACGLPVIVPEGGPTDDFVDEGVGWRIAADKKPFGSSHVGEWEFCGPAWMFEVDPHDLAAQMRHVFQNREQAREKGQAAAQRVRAGWTWRHATQKVLERLEALSGEPVREVATDPATRSRNDQVGTIQPFADLEKSQNARSAGGLWLPDLQKKAEGIGSLLTASHGKTDQGASLGRAQPIGRPQPTISLCMIVKNEERVLDACLQSVKPWVDEIIVVDTGSTDATVKIAQNHGARVFHYPWTDSFSEARNVSLEHATGEWLFWMDADDTLPEECGKQLRELALTAADATTGFLMQVHIPPAPGENGFTIVDHVKLFRNWPELRFEGRIHEQILEAIFCAGGRIERSEAHVVHSGYDYSVEGQKHKRERDIGLLEKDLADRPDHPFVLFNIGMTSYHLKDYDMAVPALEKSLALSKPQESTVRKVYAMLAGCALEQGQLEGAKTWLEKGLALFPHDPELLFRGGIIYRDLGDLQAAERSYVKLLTEREVGHIDSLDVSMTGFKAHHNLALIYQDMNRWGEAEGAFKAAVADSPGFVPSWLGLGELYLRAGRMQEARGVVEKLRQLAPEAAEQLGRHLPR